MILVKIDAVYFTFTHLGLEGIKDPHVGTGAKHLVEVGLTVY